MLAKTLVATLACTALLQQVGATPSTYAKSISVTNGYLEDGKFAGNYT